MINFPCKTDEGSDHVEFLKVQGEIFQLENDLAKNELDLEILRTDLADFEKKYIRLTGNLYAQLDLINNTISKIMSAKENSDSSFNDDDQMPSEEQFGENAYESDSSSIDEPQDAPSDSIKSLYRQLAKLVHPDLTTDENERVRRQQVMAEVNKAFRSRDESRLKEILVAWEKGEAANPAKLSNHRLAELTKKAAQIRSRIQEIEHEIIQIKSGSLYRLMQDVEHAKMEGRNLLDDMCVYIKKDIDLALARLNTIKGEAVNNA